MDEQKRKILDFLRIHKLGVVSTVTADGKPQGAVVEFAVTDDVEIVFNTFTTYRKYANLQGNPHVSFTIGWDEDITVQYEGTASELSGEKLEECKRIFAAKVTDAPKWDSFPETRYFIVKPTWIRYNDLNKESKEAFVVKF